MRKKLIQSAAAAATAALVFSAITVIAWTGPGSTAPNGNVAAPVNVGASTQIKTGGLWALSMGTDNGYCIGSSCIDSWSKLGSQWLTNGTDIYYNAGNVGIGTASPDQKLRVNGNLTVASTAASTPSVRNSGLRLWIDQSFGMELLYNGGWRTALYTRSPDGDIAFGTYAPGATGQSSFSEMMTVEGQTGNVGIGTTNPGAKLEVAGQVKITGGTPGTGKVLTSDASGLASWATPTGGSQWSESGSNIYYNAGNVGIGTASPNSKLDVRGQIEASSGALVARSNASNWGGNAVFMDLSGAYGRFAQYNFDTGAYGPLVIGNNWLAIDSSGKVSIRGSLNIGVGSGQTNATMAARGANANTFEWGHSNTGGFQNMLGYEIGTGRGFVAFNSEAGTNSNTYRTRGRAGTVIRSDTSGGLTVLTIPSTNADNQAGTVIMELSSAGALTASSFLYSSDQRLKEHVAPLKDSLEKVLALQGVSFTWREGTKKAGQEDIGFIAQEVEKVVPELVSHTADGYEAVDYARVAPLLVNAIHEQQATIDAQQKQIDELSDAVRKLQDR